MKISRFTSVVRGHPAEGGNVVYHWQTQAMLVVDDELAAILSQGAPVTESDLPSEIVGSLLEAGVLVDADADESAQIREWHQDVRSDRTTFRAVVVTTYECNFACPYCVEKGITKGGHMDGPTTAKAVEWIIAQTERQGCQKLFVNFYGGEPLLNASAALEASGALQGYAQDAGVQYEASITTNGSLLDAEMCTRLTAAGISWAKITLDGDRERHDSKRMFKSGAASFDLILANIEAVCARMGVWIGGNFELGDLDSARRLMDELEARGLTHRLRGVRFGGVSAAACEGLAQGHVEQAAGACEDADGEGEMAAALLGINRELAERGFRVRKGTGVRLCMLDQPDNAAVIDPLGDMYRCPAMVGHEELVVGSIWGGDVDDRALRLCEEDLVDCIECRWFPACGGGCRFGSLLKSGDARRRNCQRPYYERYADELIKVDYDMLERERRPEA